MGLVTAGRYYTEPMDVDNRIEGMPECRMVKIRLNDIRQWIILPSSMEQW